MSVFESRDLNSYFSDRSSDVFAEREEAIRLGIIDRDWTYISTPLVLKEESIHDLQEDLSIISRLIFDLPNRLHNGNGFNFFRSLGFQSPLAELMSNQSPIGVQVPLRWDLMSQGDECKILELNTGYALGGANFSLLRDFYDQNDLQRKGQFSLADSMAAIIDLMKEQLNGLPEDSTLALLEEDELYEKYEFFLKSFSRYIEKHTAYRVIVGPASKVCFEKENPSIDLIKVDAFLGMFNIFEMFEKWGKYGPFVEALTLGRWRSVVPLGEFGFSCKSVLSLLSDPLNRRYFSQSEQEAISRRIPRTENLKSLSTLSSSTQFMESVLKPSDGYAGEGIVCSWETATVQHWELTLKEAIASGREYVLQERVKSDPLKIQTISADQKIEFGEAAPVFGILMVQGRIVGGVVRAILGATAPGVINAQQGAAVGPLVFGRKIKV